MKWSVVQCLFNTLEFLTAAQFVTRWLYVINVDFVPSFTALIMLYFPWDSQGRICPLVDKREKGRTINIIFGVIFSNVSLYLGRSWIHGMWSRPASKQYKDLGFLGEEEILAFVEMLFLINFIKNRMVSSSFESEFSS